jgi:hypothetical protein
VARCRRIILGRWIVMMAAMMLPSPEDAAAWPSAAGRRRHGLATRLRLQLHCTRCCFGLIAVCENSTRRVEDCRASGAIATERSRRQGIWLKGEIGGERSGTAGVGLLRLPSRISPFLRWWSSPTRAWISPA